MLKDQNDHTVIHDSSPNWELKQEAKSQKTRCIAHTQKSTRPSWYKEGGASTRSEGDCTTGQVPDSRIIWMTWTMIQWRWRSRKVCQLLNKDGGGGGGNGRNLIDITITPFIDACEHNVYCHQRIRVFELFTLIAHYDSRSITYWQYKSSVLIWNIHLFARLKSNLRRAGNDEEDSLWSYAE